MSKARRGPVLSLGGIFCGRVNCSELLCRVQEETTDPIQEFDVPAFSENALRATTASCWPFRGVVWFRPVGRRREGAKRFLYLFRTWQERGRTCFQGFAHFA